MSDLVYGSVWRDLNDGEIVMMLANFEGYHKALVLKESNNPNADSNEGEVHGRVMGPAWERVE